MENVIRSLVFEEKVSLTIADTTEIVREAIERHALSKASALVLGKLLSAATYMSACLKEESGEISLSLKSDGEGGGVSVSGNYALRMRGYIENTVTVLSESEVLGKEGVLTVVRDDGYSRPFVGACGLDGAKTVDELIEEYFETSEQLPTYVALSVEFDENGALVFAGVIALQPLPFTDEETKEKLPRGESLKAILENVRTVGLKGVANGVFSAKKDGITYRQATYKCNCSKEYLEKVLVSVGEEQMRTIIEEDGAVRVHCHYCNTDYAFYAEDADRIFKK